MTLLYNKAHNKIKLVIKQEFPNSDFQQEFPKRYFQQEFHKRYFQQVLLIFLKKGFPKNNFC